jgi:hypothetical protein
MNSKKYPHHNQQHYHQNNILLSHIMELDPPTNKELSGPRLTLTTFANKRFRPVVQLSESSSSHNNNNNSNELLDDLLPIIDTINPFTRAESGNSWNSSTTSRVASPMTNEAGMLMDTLKRIRISRRLPGQLRLARDMEELRQQPWMMNEFPFIALDENNDSILHVHGLRGQFCIVTNKRYPHSPPSITTSVGIAIPLEILQQQNWRCTFSLIDVFHELVQYTPQQLLIMSNNQQLLHQYQQQQLLQLDQQQQQQQGGLFINNQSQLYTDQPPLEIDDEFMDDFTQQQQQQQQQQPIVLCTTTNNIMETDEI